MDPAAAPSRANACSSLTELNELIVTCRACPRLVEWREKVAVEKRASFANESYWGKPVPGFGDTDARLLIVGLAPAAHGANRTGRLFTGDRSGDVLFAALHRVGLANQGVAQNANDGLELFDVRISSPVRCAPPQNKPTVAERNTCAPFLARELEILAPSLKAIFILGAFGWQATLNVLAKSGWILPKPRPKFQHKAFVELSHKDGRKITLIGCYHVSQQNTFTGKLTPDMLDEALQLAKSVR